MSAANVTMKAPASLPPGSQVTLSDGTTTTVDVNSLVSVPAVKQAQLVDAGFLFTPSSVVLGVVPGFGGAVTQLTSKSTGVTLSKMAGQITMNNAALGAGAEAAFTVTNTLVAAADVPLVCVGSGGTSSAYGVDVTAVGAGTFEITVSNLTAGSLSEAVVLNFVIMKGASA